MIVDGIFDWAVQEPGPAARIAAFGGARTNLSVIIAHSLEGWHRPGGYRAYEDPTRFPTLWHGTNGLDGVLHQHADYRLRLQHAHAGNVLGPGFEAEGFAGEPLTKAQEDTFLHIVQDIEDDTGRKYERNPTAQYRLAEHNEVAGRNYLGQKKTQCPSGRYDGLWQRLGDDMDYDKRLSDAESEIAALKKWRTHVDKYLDGLNTAQWEHKAGGARQQHNQERPK